MACLQTKSRDEALAFCRRLIARGYKQVPPAHSIWEHLKYREFRIYRHRNWIRVAYQEHFHEGEPKKPIPVLKPPHTSKRGGPCEATPGCKRKALYRGACAACWRRYRYWHGSAECYKAHARKAHAKQTARARARAAEPAA